MYKKSFIIKKNLKHHEQPAVYCKQRHLKMIAVSEFLKHMSLYENEDPDIVLGKERAFSIADTIYLFTVTLILVIFIRYCLLR